MGLIVLQRPSRKINGEKLKVTWTFVFIRMYVSMTPFSPQVAHSLKNVLCVCLCPCVDMWKTEVDIRNYPLLLFTLLFGNSLSVHMDLQHDWNRLGGQQDPGILKHLCPSKYRPITLYWTSYLHAGEPAQFFRLWSKGFTTDLSSQPLNLLMEMLLLKGKGW